MRKLLLTQLFVATAVFASTCAQAQWTESGFSETFENFYVYEYGQSNTTEGPIWVTGSKAAIYYRSVSEDWLNTDLEGAYFPSSPNWRSGYQTVFDSVLSTTYSYTNLKLSAGERVQIQVEKTRTMGYNGWSYATSSLTGHTTRYRTWESLVNHYISAVPN